MSRKEFRITNKIRHDFKLLAARLPQEFYTIKSVDAISGEEAALTGLTPPEGEERFNPEQNYLFESPLLCPVNHFRRMCKAYKKGGASAVTSYISACVERNKQRAEA